MRVRVAPSSARSLAQKRVCHAPLTGVLDGFPAEEGRAWRMGFIDDQQVERLAAEAPGSGYGDYLTGLLAEAARGLPRY